MNTNFTLTPFHKLPIDGATGLHFDVQFDRYFDSAESRDASIEFGGLVPKSGKSRPRPPEDNRSISINDYDGFVEAANFEATIKAMQAEEQASAEFIYTPPPPDYLDVEQIPVDAINKPHVEDYIEITPATFTLSNFMLNGESRAMSDKMLDDVFVLDGIAILGQATAIYAKPNTGKTLLVLWMLIKSIQEKRVDASKVFYINADDTYKGLVTKLRIAETHGFGMIAPSFNGFEADKFQSYLRLMIDGGTAHGSVIILDTVKKFTDLMDKKQATNFMKIGREFVSAGGTLIMMAHTNKNRDAEGKVVFAGTSDIVDDCDCAYLLDEVSKTDFTKTVLFENFKSRGDVARELSFTYSVIEKQSYMDLIDSVEVADVAATEQAKKDKLAAYKLEKDAVAIEVITDAINQGNHKQPDLLKYAKGAGVSDAKCRKALKDYAGEKVGSLNLWRVIDGEKNAKIYYLFSSDIYATDEYETAKNG